MGFRGDCVTHLMEEVTKEAKERCKCAVATVAS